MRRALAIVVTFFGLAAPAHATDFDVNGVDDQPPASAICNGTDCPSLRAAVLAANANPGHDNISLPTGAYALTQGEIQITESVYIIGNDPRTTTITRTGATNFRLFNVMPGADGVFFSFVTLSNGSTTASGGDILNAGNLGLAWVHVTGGTARGGGGVAVVGPGTMTVYGSLFDGNQASNLGGAILLTANAGAQSDAATVTVQDSTITGNTSPGGAGAGIATTGNDFNVVGLYQATVARNGATGLYRADNGTFVVNGSIVGSNGVANCNNVPTDLGGNIEDQNSCGFSHPTSLHGVDPKLAGATSNEGGPTDVLPILSGSPAVDIVRPCAAPVDQRDFDRVVSLDDPCDAGAFELTPLSGTSVQIDSGPVGTASGGTATFAFSAPGTGVTFECSLSGPGQNGAFESCVSPKTYTGLAPGSYLFGVRTTGSSQVASRQFSVPGGAGVAQATPTPTPTPVATATPVPQQSVAGKTVSGTVLVKTPGGKFVPLDPSKPIPDGSEIDTTKGKIELTAQQTKGGALQKATFYDGIFKVTQTTKTTDLTLSQKLAPCGKAAAAAKKPKTRKLWGDGSGSFRTRGQYSAATVRGTKWLVQDSCKGTLTQVATGVVSVFDDVKHKTIVLRAGKKYLAKPRR